MGKVKVRECVDRKELFDEFVRLTRQEQKETEDEDIRDALQDSIIRLQNILF